MPRLIRFFLSPASRLETYLVVFAAGSLLFCASSQQRASEPDEKRLEKLLDRLEEKLEKMSMTQSNNQQIHVDGEAAFRDQRIREQLGMRTSDDD